MRSGAIAGAAALFAAAAPAQDRRTCPYLTDVLVRADAAVADLRAGEGSVLRLLPLKVAARRASHGLEAYGWPAGLSQTAGEMTELAGALVAGGLPRDAAAAQRIAVLRDRLGGIVLPVCGDGAGGADAGAGQGGADGPAGDAP